MTDYKQLELKVAEMQKEIERLKKEEKENSLPDNFNRQHAINMLKAVDSYDACTFYTTLYNESTFRKSLYRVFLWTSTSQGWEYWNRRYHDVNLFTDEDYAQIQKWIILSFQQEVK